MGILLALLAASLAHPNSLSSSRIVVEGARVRHELLVQPEALAEVLLGIDADGDGRLDARELAARSEGVAEYVARHYRLFADGGRALELERRVESVELAPPPFPTPAASADWVRVRSSFEAPARLELLAIEMRLFFLTSPDHRDFCSLRWDGVAAFETTFSEFEPRRAFRREDVPPNRAWGWAALGAREMLLGFEHLAFLALLLAGSTSPRAALRAVACFTFARWVGFGVELAAPELLPARFVGLSVALSSAFLGAQVLARREARPLDLEAGAFGLVHGLDLGRAAREATALLEPRLGAELLFGLGAELGQLFALTLGWLAWRLARRAPRPELVRGALSVAGVLLGLGWFVARAGWL